MGEFFIGRDPSPVRLMPPSKTIGYKVRERSVGLSGQSTIADQTPRIDWFFPVRAKGFGQLFFDCIQCIEDPGADLIFNNVPAPSRTTTCSTSISTRSFSIFNFTFVTDHGERSPGTGFADPSRNFSVFNGDIHPVRNPGPGRLFLYCYGFRQRVLLGNGHASFPLPHRNLQLMQKNYAFEQTQEILAPRTFCPCRYLPTLPTEGLHILQCSVPV